MNKDRIQIDGVWYVREQEEKHELLDVTYFQGCVMENSNFAFEASRINKSEDEFYDDIDIEVTDKRTKPWKTEHWDNNNFFRGILNNDSTSLSSLRNGGDIKITSKEDIDFLKSFLNYLKDIKWLQA